MAVARTLHIWFCYVYLVLLPVQFLLAGMGIFGGDIQVHMMVGGLVLHVVIPALLLITAGIGRMGWAQAGWSVLLFLILTAQIAMVDVGRNMDVPLVSGLHPLIALLTWPYVYFVILGRARGRDASGHAVGPDPVTV